MMVTMIIQTMLIANSASGWRLSIVSVLPTTSARDKFTTWVKGKIAMATACATKGSDERGKKVPLKKSIGVTNRNVG